MIVIRGDTGAARGLKPYKTPITWQRAATAAALFYFAKSRSDQGLAGLTFYGAPE